jgi:hypothetical protein
MKIHDSDTSKNNVATGIHNDSEQSSICYFYLPMAVGKLNHTTHNTLNVDKTEK